MIFASTGMATGAFGVLATTIGSGLVVGSFAAGLLTVAVRCSREEAEQLVLNGSYLGGLLALLGLAVDILEKHFV